jgi:hypothetical protein
VLRLSFVDKRRRLSSSLSTKFRTSSPPVQEIQIFLINNFNTLPSPPCGIPKIASYAEPGERTKPMAKEAQIAANLRNAAIFGIYSAGDAVRPEEQDIYRLFCEGFEQDLVPEGAMETTLAAEIIHAAWRLRRCAEADSAIEDRIEGKADAQNLIDRARTQALRHFQRASAELRRIQTEGQIRNETLPEGFDAATLGLASCKDMAPILRNDVRRQLLLHKLKETEMTTAVTEVLSAPLPSAGPVPRSAPCPCGSGAKYKRCCGPNAPAVLAA